jgi:hypothetical protein
VKTNSNYTTGKLYAKLTDGCGSVTITKDVWVGRPASIGGTLTDPSSASVGLLVSYTHSNDTVPNVGTHDQGNRI